MNTTQFVILIIASLLPGFIAVILLIRLLAKGNKQDSGAAAAANELERRLDVRIGNASAENSRSISQMSSALDSSLSSKLETHGKHISERTDRLTESLSERQTSLERRLLERLQTVEAALRDIRETNEKQLDAIRGVVDEKLQHTLNERLSESFKRVEERLTEVYTGLGEMRTLASGVGDLKKVLSNVKTRGTLGELQLQAILSEILAPEQYVINFDAGKGGSERVEFAIKLPNDDRSPVYLPIDSKFPADIYIKLNDAYDSAEPARVEAAQKELRDALMKFGKDISDKYINPPLTTNFAVMFLPTEGLYAEAVRFGLIEALQNKYRINIAGPSTMAALLNSLQMGFRTLAIQKRSSEVWEILSKIKKEFKAFDDVLTSTKKALDKANSDLDKLVGTRTRQILRTLDRVEELPEQPSGGMLGIDAGGESDSAYEA